MFVYIGTYTEPIRFGSGKTLQGKGEGIYVYRMDQTSGELELAHKVTGVDNPSYLAFHPSGRQLYAVNELKSFEGEESGTVSAFALDPRSGGLRFLNRKLTHGTDPCHVTVHRSGRNILVANFMSGSVCVLPLLEDGSLGEATDVVQHQGSSVDPVRQAGPHAHAVVLDEPNRYAFVPDLGIDELAVYELDSRLGKLEASDRPWIDVNPGAGPRHFTFHPSGKFAYLINELDSTIDVFQYDGNSGTLTRIESTSTLPPDFHGHSTCAYVMVSPSGAFLYGSNRGHDSIVIYGIDRATGRLSHVGHEPALGETPRHFTIDPSGRFLFAANQDTDTVVTFSIDQETGELHPCGRVVRVPTPVCVKALRG